MKRWVTKSGVVVEEHDRKTTPRGVRIYAVRADTGGKHGWLRLEQLRPAED